MLKQKKQLLDHRSEKADRQDLLSEKAYDSRNSEFK